MKKDAQDERIAAILGEIEDSDFDETIDTFYEYLKTNLSLPCEVIGIEDFRWEEIYVFGPGNKKEYEQLKKTQPSYTDRYELFEIVRNAQFDTASRFIDTKSFNALPQSNELFLRQALTECEFEAR